MKLKDKILEDMKVAMRAKDRTTLSALRAIKSEILLTETGKDSMEIDESVEIKMLQKLVKQRKDSAEIYIQQNRTDLSEPELAEVKVIEKYLPKMLSENEIEAEVKQIILDLGASTMKDMGKVMSEANKKLAGKAEGKKIADKVKALLA